MAAQITEGYTGAKMTVPMPPNFPTLQFEQHLLQSGIKCPVIPAERNHEASDGAGPIDSVSQRPSTK